MTFPHPLIYLRNSALAGLAGIVTGTVIHSIKKYPETGKKTLIASCLSGSIGLGVGYTFGLIKKKNVYVYGLATGMNFLIVPLVFFGVRQVMHTGDVIAVFLPKEKIMELTINNSYALSIGSGSITGFLTSLYSISRYMWSRSTLNWKAKYKLKWPSLELRRKFVNVTQTKHNFVQLDKTKLSLLFTSTIECLAVASAGLGTNIFCLLLLERSLKSTVLSLIVGGALAASGQFTYNIFNKWRIRKAMQIHYPELFEKEKEVTWDEWLGDLVTRKRKLGRLDDNILKLEMDFELLEKEERELLKEQQS